MAVALRKQGTQSAQRLVQTLEHFTPLVEQVIEQTTRRLLRGESVPASEKIVSLFEPHTAILREGKPGKPTEFGRVTWLDEVVGWGILAHDLRVMAQATAH